jgi:hypothetical protein
MSGPVDDEVECPVCYSECSKDEILNCGHPLCKNCAPMITSGRCPICNKDMEGPQVNNEKLAQSQRQKEEDDATKNIIVMYMVTLIEQLAGSIGISEDIVTYPSNYNQLYLDVKNLLDDEIDDGTITAENYQTYIRDKWAAGDYEEDAMRFIFAMVDAVVEQETAAIKNLTAMVLDGMAGYNTEVYSYYISLTEDEQTNYLLALQNRVVNSSSFLSAKRSSPLWFTNDEVVYTLASVLSVELAL